MSTLFDPMDYNTPGFPVLHYLPEFAQTHVHWVDDAIQPSHSLLPPSPPALNLSQHQSLFRWVSFSHQVAKVLELQLQHQSFQWIFRTDSFRVNWFELSTVQETQREWQTTSAFLPWEPHEQYEKAKRYDTERWSPSTPAELLSPKLCYVWYLLSTQKLIVKGMWFCSDVKGFFGLAWSSETHPHSQKHTHIYMPFSILCIKD